ncbi:uncharacterized protein LOC131649016 [Vicia villosa]|uniref:uncharacterized protein LOC131649016 n=1 Tax=Vicia villosa TaxID=3911 RepID=UPI00273CE0E1|nr:uncharacterized protein LOC131649016 [Vicia villosa]
MEGLVYEMDFSVDVDFVNYKDIESLVLSVGYTKFKCLSYQHPKLSFQHGLKPLNSYGDLLQLIADSKGHSLVDVFVEHEVDIPEVVEFGNEGPLDDDVINEVPLFEDVSNAEKEGTNGVNTEVPMDSSVNTEVPKDGSVNNEVPMDGGVNTEVPMDGGVSTEVPMSNEVHLDDDVPLDNNDAEDVNMEVPNGVRIDEEVNRNSDSEKDWDYVPSEEGGNLNESQAAAYEESDQDESDMHTPVENNDEVVHKRKFPTFKVFENGVPVRVELGMQIVSKEVIIDVVKDNVMETRTNIWLKKNDAIRVFVKYQLGCPFHMLVAKRSGSQYWQVKILKPKHECVRSAGNKQAKTKWLAKNFIPLIMNTPHSKPSGLAQEAFIRWNVKLNNFQAYRAKKRALELIEGAASEKYAHLRNYAEEIRSTCIPLIGLDACFLKGEHGGQLISAIGKDGNNQIMLIAYVVVEAETRDSWKLFVDLLLEDLNQIIPRQYTFISDQQKGLVEVIKRLGENVEHRLCF